MALFCLLVCAAAAQAQTVLKTLHFTLYVSPAAARQGERAIERLEELRSSLAALRGPTWVPARPLQVWIPATERDWLQIASTPFEQGLYRSGTRRDWIVVNPAASNFIEVVGHEYIHAVLNHARPNIASWLAEGVCDYYATLELRYKGNRAAASSGRPPGNRLAWLRGIERIETEALDMRLREPGGYALAWAAAYALWPNFSDTAAPPKSIVVGDFVPRTETLPLRKPTLRLLAVAPAEIAEMEVEFAGVFGTRSPEPLLSGGDQAALRAQELFVEGLRLSDEGAPAKAAPLLAEACRLRPSNSTWWYALALAHRDANELDQARAAVGWAISTALNQSEREAAATLQRALQ